MPGLVAPYDRPVLAGRAREQAAVRALLDEARASHGSALVVSGLPGVGKSALLSDAQAEARGFIVLRTSGIESEFPLAFAALQRLLHPLMAIVGRLPAPQATALRTAFGEVAGEADRFVVFLAALSLLAEAAEQQPVLAVVDDAHWLDAASAEALLFVSRRLQAEQVSMLFAAREGDVRRFEAADLPNVHLDDLDLVGAGDLLAERVGAPVPHEVVARLMTGTGGNPLALVELADALSDDQILGRSVLPSRLPITEGVGRTFLDLYTRLPAHAQTVVLVAAADDSGRVRVVEEAAAATDAGSDGFDLAEQSGLIAVVDGMVEMRHPLVRSAVYGAASVRQRRLVHQALAGALDRAEDADRRAWHRAAAASEPDDSIVDDLEQVAIRAGRRGGHEAASAAWERAAELTAESDQRAARLFFAARASWLAAQPARAAALAGAARQDAVDPVLCADIDRLRGRIEWNVGSAVSGHRILLQAAREIADTDLSRAREMAMTAAAAATFGADSGSDVDPMSFVADPDQAGTSPSRCSALLLVGFSGVAAGRLSDAAAAFRTSFAECGRTDDVDLMSSLGLAAMHVGDDAEVLREFGRLAQNSRESGALVLVLYALTRRAVGEISVGDWLGARTGATEALALARSTGKEALGRLPLAWLALLAALRGEHASHESYMAELDGPDQSRDGGLTSLITKDVVAWAKGAAADSAPVALHHLDQVSHSLVRRMSAMDRMEAAVRAGEPERVPAWADELDDFAEQTGARWTAASAAHGRALTRDGAAAEEMFVLAMTLHEHSLHRADRARTELAFGEYLRRSRRRVDSRPLLRSALETFEDIGASRWADRAQQELRASGETARRRASSAASELTPQETQVVTLVRQGLSNREVAAQLFLSPRTVDFHLRNVFAKLGVTSRAELTALQLS